MKAEHINPFLDAFNNVIKQLLNIDTEKGKLYLKEGTLKSQGVAITIGVTGDLSGHVVLNMGETAARGIASKMMFGMPVNELDDMAKSALSELGNMVAGNSASFFANLGMSINITPPSLYTGDNMSIFSYNAKTICVPLNVDNHTVEFDLAVK